jgi:hypothetical protein
VVRRFESCLIDGGHGVVVCIPDCGSGGPGSEPGDRPMPDVGDGRPAARKAALRHPPSDSGIWLAPHAPVGGSDAASPKRGCPGPTPGGSTHDARLAGAGGRLQPCRCEGSSPRRISNGPKPTGMRQPPPKGKTARSTRAGPASRCSRYGHSQHPKNIGPKDASTTGHSHDHEELYVCQR